MPNSIARNWPWFGVTFVVILLDLATKNWMSTHLTYGEPWVITSFFNFTLLHNTGAAFSFLSDAGGWQRWFFGIVAVLVSAFIAIWMLRLGPGRRLEALALALILGGALGNLYDRVILGYVVDFLVVHYKEYYWPAFNLADSAICVGAGLLIFESLRSSKQAPQQAE